MGVHAIEIVCAKAQQSDPSTVPSPGPPDWTPQLLAGRVVDNINATYSEVVTEQAIPFYKLVPAGGATTHYRARHRWGEGSAKSTLLDDIESLVATDAKWYDIRYHDCLNGTDTVGDCPSFVSERSGGSVPNDV